MEPTTPNYVRNCYVVDTLRTSQTTLTGDRWIDGPSKEEQYEDNQRRQQPVQRGALSRAVSEGVGSDYERNGSDYD